jgi:capsular polysaccharide biosynthesis protein
MDTEAQRVKSFDVAIQTAKDFPGLRLLPAQIAARIDVGAPRDTHIILVTAKGTTPPDAAQLGRAYVDSYVGMQRARQRQRASQVQSALQYRLNHISGRSALGPLGATLRDEISLSGLIRRVQTGGPQIVEHARASGAPSQPQTQRNVLFGLLFGLVAGIGLVALRSETRTRGGVAAARRVSGVQ